MLCCEAGRSDTPHFEDLAVFVAQLAALGIDARIHVRSVLDDLKRNAQFDIAPFLFDGALEPQDRVAVIGAQDLSEDMIAKLRGLAIPPGTGCLAIGDFTTAQALIGARAKLSYAFGRDPKVMNLAAAGARRDKPAAGVPVFGVARARAATMRPSLLLIAPDLKDPAQGRALISLGLARTFRTMVLTDGEAKRDWQRIHGTEIPVYNYSEVLPAALAARVDICILFGRTLSDYRLRCLIANLAVSGAALIDGTEARSAANAWDAFIPGPVDVTGVAPFLSAEILPNRAEIARFVRGSQLAKLSAPDPVASFLGESVVSRRGRPRAARLPARVVFMPTNGVGLGHAQRCSLIASEAGRDRIEPVFAAFPSCMRLIKSYGFDVMPLIGRSSRHAQTHENDLPNYLRLRSLTSAASALVFDGIYVFDSVLRTILETNTRGVWIRRGLWPSAQDNSVALDREKVFDRVIVPGEAFDELNHPYSHAERVRAVGPVVQRFALGAGAREDLRARLAERFDIRFERLVVSLLGGGVAADRSAQVQAVCGMIERRSDALHLGVVWPTAVLHPSWFAWRNTRIVRTSHAGILAAAADLCISAAGYNSFHEMLYNAVPAIFVPQTAAFLDDQGARAAAAAARGLAATVAFNQMMTLEREIRRFLDAGGAEEIRQRLETFALPERGNAAAARLIEEVAVAG